MKRLNYRKLKEKVKSANKTQFYSLIAVLWWIPGGSIWCLLALWIRYSIQIKKFFRLKN
tara:strand:- start:50 stop:226 length:177 start_codon:yes stop_codon:yes gene_type:complete